MIKNNNNNTVQRRGRKKTHFPLQPNFGEISASFLAYHLDNASALPSPPPPPPSDIAKGETNKQSGKERHTSSRESRVQCMDAETADFSGHFLSRNKKAKNLSR